MYISLATPLIEKSKAVAALMFPGKALIRQSVFCYNSVVVKKTEYMVETVLIVNRDAFKLCV